jgi:helix-turn-helix protein
MLMAEKVESNRLTLVKPRSTWVITSKTEPTTRIDPLEQVNTHLWSTIGQRHGQIPLKNPSVFECPPELLPCSPNFT